ncbi:MULTISPECIES: ribokinase [unclassified Shewanella]|uniref:ribokinase n=1 Tax=unclassified Shewanella TaxID=196818 RepID=UPI002003E4AD|nr:MULTISPECIES: ribokinase [unclassified Shewanella]MCK7633875.1 ribokinase [Shewanella sp. JNE17]MCK7649058.1 ribokinase [Shewanella sp. JNE8]MCK7657181.1 ribokinase [Shewanella sp. JNE4-2]UPO30653.1 ribokinase [Shewanella sp. JNE2]
MSQILIIGSANADHVMKFEYLPAAGQTLMSREYRLEHGGKGANQAVACAHLAKPGAHIDFICRLGKDSVGDDMLQSWLKDGISAEGISQTSNISTGTAMIFIGDNGENTIGVAAGANADLLPEDLENYYALFANAQYLLIQLETPLTTVAKALQMAKRLGVTTVLNPAPAKVLGPNYLQWVDIITPNETEAAALTGVEINHLDDAHLAAQLLHQQGVGIVVITLGAKGAYISSPHFTGLVPAINVQAVDTVAAGDTFNGALVVGLSEGMSIDAAVGFANAASAITVTRQGAQRAIPYRHEVPN